MTRQLRKGNGKIGLVLANGGLVTYQAAICLSSSPRRDGLPYPDINPLPEIVADVQKPTVDEQAEGDAVIEVSILIHLTMPRTFIVNTAQTYTVEFNRDSSPLRGFVVGRLKSNGHRFIANHSDEATLKQLCSQNVEPIGRSGKVKTGQDGRNMFALHGDVAKL